MLTSYQRRKIRVRSGVKKNNKSMRPRIVINRSNKNIYAQIVDISGNILAQESSIKNEQKASGIEKAKFVGKNLASKCIEANILSVVFDKGAYNYNGRVKALAEACRESGLKF
ncbi:MAG: 50S ribosomal protein L18 [Alphaproteobacteria bacterium]|nr:50S ribosomal protein L18 [Alphaproteobacteria bacterium]